MFFGTFSWSFVDVSLPFHIQRISTWDATSTLRWGNPKAFFVLVQLLQGAGFFAMAAATTLPGLFVSRLVLGVMGAPRLAEVLPERGLIAGLLIGSSVSVGALAVAPGVWSYGVLRFVQVLCIAPVFPIVVARIGASFVGPVVATSLLAAGSPMLLYAGLALAALACLPLSAMRAHVPARAR